MDSLPGAVSLARALLALSRSRSTGVLHVNTERGSCRIAVCAGIARAASGLEREGQPLGDALVRDGALDVRAHGEALERSDPQGGPVGAWLVGSGLVTRPALERALRTQLRDRVLSLFACRSLDYRFEPGAADIGVALIDEPMASGDLVIAALRAQVANLTEAQLLRTIEPGELRLNALGRSLTRGAALWPEEAAAVSLLARGATLEEILRVTHSAPRALRISAALSLLPAVVSEPLRTQRFTLLLRKREQVRRTGDARALLDLPAEADPAAGRRALRRLAKSLHPDALGPHAPAELREASNEVMEALVGAEYALRVGEAE